MKNIENIIRNSFHILIGFTIGYIFFFITKINTYPINKEFWHNSLSPLIAFVITAWIGFFWERRQEVKYGANFDIKDVLRSGLGGLLGGIFSFILVSKVLMLVLFIVSAILIIRDLKK
jgi:uncharacterized membrane protein YadS